MRPSSPAALAALLLFAAQRAAAYSCSHLNNCTGHGECDTATGRCKCFTGWGAATDVALYKAPDCSQRTCPADKAWVDVPSGPNQAHRVAECSAMGLCDRRSGRCRCFAGYEGEACQRSACPGAPSCSGHGKCVSLKSMASDPNAVPFGPAGSYGGSPDTITWDEDKVQGCVCDSAWPVGYGAGQTQATQFHGSDCSLKRCPSNDDPRTLDVDETDCAYMDQNGAVWKGIVGSDGKRYAPGATLPVGVTAVQAAYGTPGVDQGAPGNKCYVECSNRGKCDYKTGTCACHNGYAGSDCGVKLVQLGK